MPGLERTASALIPEKLRDWLALRWKSAYDICFKEGERYWSTFPLTVFAPLANVEVVNQPYAIPWYYEVSL